MHQQNFFNSEEKQKNKKRPIYYINKRHIKITTHLKSLDKQW